MSKVQVNPAILRWARETAGLGLEEAATKISLGALKSRNLDSADRLAAMEDGAEAPTRALLVRMSKQYRRPLLAFYMAEPPRKGDRGQDFRSLPPDHPAIENAWLDALIRDALARQSIVRSVLEDEDEAEVLSFIGSKTVDDGVAVVRDALSATLQFNVREFRAQQNAGDAFNLLRGYAEAAGVFVILRGDLGSYHTSIDVQTFRGFALADPVAPFVIINDNDAKAAWSFTLLHELTHLFLGQTGVSGERADIAVERFCNDVAGGLLLPNTELAQLQIGSAADIETVVAAISAFARERNVSSSMVAYKLFRARRIRRELWQTLRERFRDLWAQARDTRREGSRGQEGGGPDYYVVRRHRMGNSLVSLVERMIAAKALTTSKAGKVLGVKPINVHRLFAIARR
ncbi:MAG: ImmA/IrrE family metallo-endopeptidase [Gammaproteobacteria bacterium]|nr:ImmA/IrrE family metallo-endopeptidase [Gammaproteobacteria bacterium]